MRYGLDDLKVERYAKSLKANELLHGMLEELITTATDGLKSTPPLDEEHTKAWYLLQAVEDLRTMINNSLAEIELNEEDNEH